MDVYCDDDQEYVCCSHKQSGEQVETSADLTAEPSATLPATQPKDEVKSTQHFNHG